MPGWDGCDENKVYSDHIKDPKNAITNDAEIEVPNPLSVLVLYDLTILVIVPQHHLCVDTSQ